MMDMWDWFEAHKVNKARNQILEKIELLELAAVAVEALYIELQGHALSDQYEVGYADAIAQAVKVIRGMK
jgi:hypothetical protein